MNQSHYPSLELCKKLKKIGMKGDGEYGYAEWQGYNGDDEFQKTEFTSKESFYDLGKRKAEGGKWMDLGWIFIDGYSVMEMLDVIPTNTKYGELCIFKDMATYICFEQESTDIDKYFKGTPPNALAEMILWLHENNYISFTK